MLNRIVVLERHLDLCQTIHDAEHDCDVCELQWPEKKNKAIDEIRAQVWRQCGVAWAERSGGDDFGQFCEDQAQKSQGKE